MTVHVGEIHTEVVPAQHGRRPGAAAGPPERLGARARSVARSRAARTAADCVPYRSRGLR